jgi:hypothetical protein
MNKRALLWQVPDGNRVYRSENNTDGHYQDNRPEYFLNGTNGRSHIQAWANYGVMGVMFGAGAASQTHYFDSKGDGITNPAAINGNDQLALYADDDGGYIRSQVQAYYLGGAVPLPGSGSSSPTPTRTSTRVATSVPTNTATFTPVRTNTSAPTNTPVRTNTPVATNTPTRTNTPARTNTSVPSNTPVRTNTPASTSTPGTRILVGHVIWQGRATQPNAQQVSPITLTLKTGGTEVDYPQQNTDASGFFTVNVSSLASRAYNWRVKGPQFLANGGSLTLTGAPITNLEAGLMYTGDCDNNNRSDISDFNIVKGSLGRSPGSPGYDPRADLDGDGFVTGRDFTLWKVTMNMAGAPPPAP